jgi:hypothetical protein
MYVSARPTGEVLIAGRGGWDIPVVRIHELIVVDAVGGVALHTLDGGLTGVEGDDIVDECLSGGREGDGFRGVGFVVACGMGLADLESLAGSVGGVLWEVGCMVDVAVARHLAGSSG